MFESPVFLDYQKNLLQTCDDDLDPIIKESGYKIDDLNRDMRIIREWMKQSPHLTHIELDDRLLKRNLCTTGFSVEKTKRKIDSFYSCRSQYPDIFSNRNLCDPLMLQTTEIVHYCILPKKTKKNYRVSVTGFTKCEGDKVDPMRLFKLLFMVADMRSFFDTNIGEVVIIDFENMTFTHIMKMTPHIKMLFSLLQDTYYFKVKEVHLLNVPSYAHGAVELMRSLLKEKISERFMFHKNIESLQQSLPLELLPKDFGGTQPHCQELIDRWKEMFLSPLWRQWFLDFEKEKSNESMRPESEKDSTYGVAGTFKKINLD